MSSPARFKAVVLITACVAFSPVAMAEEGAKTGYYTMHQADEGFLRLNTRTGAVAYCQKEDSWTCKPVEGAEAEDREQITRLEQDNLELQRKIRVLEDLLVRQGGEEKLAVPPGTGKGKSGFGFPSEKDVDQALDYFESMMRKFKERLKRLEEDKPQENGKAL